MPGKDPGDWSAAIYSRAASSRGTWDAGCLVERVRMRVPLHVRMRVLGPDRGGAWEVGDGPGAERGRWVTAPGRSRGGG